MLAVLAQDVAGAVLEAIAEQIAGTDAVPEVTEVMACVCIRVFDPAQVFFFLFTISFVFSFQMTPDEASYEKTKKHELKTSQGDKPQRGDG